MAKLFAAPAVSSLRVSTFKGMDVSMPDDQIALYRAADSLNMIPDASGEVRKRPGIQYDPYESTLSDVTGTVLEIYPKQILIAEDKNTIQDVDWKYVLYRWADNKWNKTVYTSKKPTVIPYGNKSIVFMTNGAIENGGEGELFDDAGEIDAYLKCAVGILDGTEFHIYRSNSKKTVYGNEKERIKGWEPDDKYMTTPTITINGDPNGGGIAHQQINLLNPWVTESFCVSRDVGNHTFCLKGLADCGKTEGRAYGNEDAMTQYFRAWIRVLNESESDNDDPDWKERYPGNAVSGDKYNPEYNRIFFDRTENQKFYGASDVCNIMPSQKDGEDNVRITYKRRGFRESFATVCHGMCGGVYGVGGYKDRLFVGGSDLDDGKNIVYYSEMDQPLYIGALNYIHSEQGSEILGLNGTGGTLAVLTDRGVALVSGQVSEGNENSFVTDSIYTISTTIPAPKPIGYNNTATFGGEIVYLSEDGVIAIAAKDNYDERYAEHRSALINRKMLADKPQKILNYGRYLLVFCADGYCWLLDENQPSSAGDQPYSSHQYEGFRMSGFAFDAVYVEDGVLKLISDQYVHRWTEGNAAEEYADKVMELDVRGFKEKTKEIIVFWETPWIYGSNFYRKKRFSRLALLMGEANLGDYQFKVEGKKNDETEWSTIWDYDGTFCTFNYGRVNYGLFTYRTTHACPDVVRKIKIKKALRFKLRFSNDLINQSFVLREFGLDYVLGG